MDTKLKDKGQERNTEGQPGQQPSAWFQVTIISIYFVLLGFFLLSGLISFWPSVPPSDEVAPISSAQFLSWSFLISSEVRLILIVTMAGALGSLVHGFRSLFWYVGNRAFVKSWTLMYLLLPLIGASLSMIFYFVLRGGLFSPDASVDATSPFGFAGISGLVGMFSNRAALKLQEIAESIFSTKESTKGKDSVESRKTDEKEPKDSRK